MSTETTTSETARPRELREEIQGSSSVSGRVDEILVLEAEDALVLLTAAMRPDAYEHDGDSADALRGLQKLGWLVDALRHLEGGRR